MMLRARRYVPALMLMLIAQVSPARTAGAQVPMPPPEIQELLAKAGRGERLTPAEQKTLADWGRAMGEQMKQAARSQQAAPQNRNALGPETPSSEAATAAEAASAAGSVFKQYDNETSKTEFDGLTIWQRELWPVFSHPRCLNCHGVVNPMTGENHGGGKIPGVTLNTRGGEGNNQIDQGPDGMACAQCHTADIEFTPEGEPGQNGPWMLAPENFVFKGVSSTELCARMSGNVRGGSEAFFDHFENDPRIRLSFVGLRGIDKQSPFWDEVQPAAPPPMTHEQFLAALHKWALIGGGSCGWSGTITYHEQSKTDGSALAGSYHKAHESHAQLTVKASRASGTVRYADDHTGHTDGNGCRPTTDSKSTEGGSGTGEGAISVQRRPDGRYSIAFPLFPANETGRETMRVTYTGCRDPGPGYPEEMRPLNRTDTRNRTSRQGTVEVYLKGSAKSSANRITGSIDSTSTDPDGSKTTITATWDLQTP